MNTLPDPEVIDIEGQTKLALIREYPNLDKLLIEREKLVKEAEKFNPVTDISQTVEMADAKALRWKFVKCRTAIDGGMKDAMESYRDKVTAGNIIRKKLRDESEEIENWLKESEDFEAIYEAGRLAELRAARHKVLLPYGTDWAAFSVENMTTPQFATFERVQKEEFERQVRAQQESEQREKEERERDRIEAERARAALAKERQERAEADALAQKEREAVEKAALEERKKAQAVLDAANKAADEERRKAQVILDAERQQREALELAERQRVEAQAALDREEADRKKKAARAPDKEKILEVASTLEYWCSQLPKMKTEDGKALMKWIDNEGDKFVALIRIKAADL